MIKIRLANRTQKKLHVVINMFQSVINRRGGNISVPFAVTLIEETIRLLMINPDQVPILSPANTMAMCSNPKRPTI